LGISLDRQTKGEGDTMTLVCYGLLRHKWLVHFILGRTISPTKLSRKCAILYHLSFSDFIKLDAFEATFGYKRISLGVDLRGAQIYIYKKDSIDDAIVSGTLPLGVLSARVGLSFDS
jgi:hypothetical protein